MSSSVLVPVSMGELIDKLTILAIKRERIIDPEKSANVCREYAALEARWHEIADGIIDIKDLEVALRKVNESLWDVENHIRIEESNQRFESRFIELARSVYHLNDERADIKLRINKRVGSELQEEKSYAHR